MKFIPSSIVIILLFFSCNNPSSIMDEKREFLYKLEIISDNPNAIINLKLTDGTTIYDGNYNLPIIYNFDPIFYMADENENLKYIITVIGYYLLVSNDSNDKIYVNLYKDEKMILSEDSVYDDEINGNKITSAKIYL